MITRTANRQTVAWFVDLLNRQLIDPEPPYQRRSVWTESYRRYFIDTIMRNYSSPPIFLNSVINSSGIIKYFVVDGKQRLESIMEFVNDKIAIPDDFGDKELDGKYFSELSDSNKKKLWGYEIPVEYLSDASEETINATFDRLNRNVLKLTAQELRHAKFDGRFITLINDIVDESFWAEICISRPAMIRRMRDIEFISELFLLTMHGIQTTTKDSLDEYYGKYDDEIPDEKEHRKNFEKIKKIILALNLNICSNRLKLYSDFYSFWAALLEFKDKKFNLSKTQKNILEFMVKVDKNDKDSVVKAYVDAVSAQPNSAKNREIRRKIIVKLISSK